MYNLAISADENAWKKPRGFHDYEASRVAHEYTTNTLQDKYKGNLQALTENPTLFAYEQGSTSPAQVGWITKVEQLQGTVRIHYEMQPDFPTVPVEKLTELSWDLDFGRLEIYRTHFAVKDVNLLSVLIAAKIVEKRQTEKGRTAEAANEERPPAIQIKPEVFRIPAGHPDPKLASVMMPFGKEFKDVHVALQQACKDAGITLERVDNIWQEDAIIDDIFSLLYRSTYVICDFTGKNPNVFYEAGIAHTLGRTVIPIVQKEDHVPFDLRHRRYQLYEDSKEGLASLQAAVTNRLKTLIALKG
ncbi:hypothetical protein AB7783_28665 [Tardiphaga sp. 172_B4_N1_3]|uniref:hypothetical protein n=1 Tax=Tardiphaga sp. 172_B4_N1_3 TaxID=3240787 RepID=UPI003F8A11C3